MNAQKPTRPDRAERVARSMLAFALVSAVIWALAGEGGPLPDFSLTNLWR